MADQQQLALARKLLAGQIGRRDFLKQASALGISAAAASLFLRAAPLAAAQDAELVPPLVAEPATGEPPFAGQTVTVLVNTGGGEKGSIEGPFHEVRAEFEAATGATLNIAAVPFEEHFPKLIEDAASGTGQYDTSIAGAWWLGDLVAADFIINYDDMYADTSGKFPQWDYDAVLPGPARCWSTAARSTWSPTTMTARCSTTAATCLPTPTTRRPSLKPTATTLLCPPPGISSRTSPSTSTGKT